MKKLILLLVCAAFVSSANLLAQDKVGSWTLGGSVGATNITSPKDAKDNTDVGLAISGQFGRVLKQNVTLLPAVVEYNSVGVKGSSENATGLSFTPSVKVHGNLGNKVVPFGIVGLGLYHWSVEDMTENDFGLNVGGGVEFAVNEKASITAGLKYHYVFSSKDKDVFGDKSSYLSFGAGVTFYLTK